MQEDVSNTSESVMDIEDSALFHDILQRGIHLLVLGEVTAGKSTLISSCIDQPASADEQTLIHTIKFHTNDSSIAEISGLHTSNKNRGKLWQEIVECVANNQIDTIWFCVASDFVDNNDEIWHWVKCLMTVCRVIIVRTKCLSPSQGLVAEFKQRFPSNTPPVIFVLAKDMQLNPKGGGATVDAYGVDDLMEATKEAMKNGSVKPTSAALSKLRKQVASDLERYAGEEAHRGAILNSLRSLSGSEETNSEPFSKKDALGDEDFEMIPRPESPGTGFVHLVKSKPARAAIGALVAFAVFLFIIL